MREKVGKPDGFLVGFHRPPGNSIYHLHLHLIELPLKKEYELSHGLFLVPAMNVIKELEVNLPEEERGKINFETPP